MRSLATRPAPSRPEEGRATWTRSGPWPAASCSPSPPLPPQGQGRREAGRRGVDGPCTRRGPSTTIEIEQTHREAGHRPARLPTSLFTRPPDAPEGFNALPPGDPPVRPPSHGDRRRPEGGRRRGEETPRRGGCAGRQGGDHRGGHPLQASLRAPAARHAQGPVQARGEARRHRARGHEGHAHQGDRRRDDPRRVPGQRARHEGAGTPAARPGPQGDDGPRLRRGDRRLLRHQDRDHAPDQGARGQGQEAPELPRAAPGQDRRASTRTRTRRSSRTS